MKAVLIYGETVYMDDFIPFPVPIIMWLLGGADHSFLCALKMFLIIILAGGFVFGLVAINAGHHHPEIVHDGDAIR